MKFFAIVKILFLGAILQIALVFVLGLVGSAFAIYSPWFELGEWLLPSRGPGSHAMGGVGGLFFSAIGFVLYTVLFGYVLDSFLTSRRSNH